MLKINVDETPMECTFQCPLKEMRKECGKLVEGITGEQKIIMRVPDKRCLFMARKERRR